MKSDVQKQASEYRKAHQKKKRRYSMLLCLASVVVLCTTYALILPAVTMGHEHCDIPEHTHTEDCYEQVTTTTVEKRLICTESEEDGHVHTDQCYETVEIPVTEEVLVCGMEEHKHTLACYSDPTADTETPEVWEQSFKDAGLTGEWRDDIIAIAETQLGYTESKENYKVLKDGDTKKGYTRYGAWYGNPYGDWCAEFVSFCLHYAGVPEKDFPEEAACSVWIEKLKQEECDLYRPAISPSDSEKDESYTPEAGDIVFFSWNQDGSADHVGIVTEVIPETETEPAKIKTIEGNKSDCVKENTYDINSGEILGYGVIPKQNFSCGKKGHIHTEECFDGDGNLICGLEEHIHTDICLKEPESEILTSLKYRGSDYSVSVTYGEDAGLPDGVELKVEELPAESDEYKEYYSRTVSTLEKETAEKVRFARFFDIYFTYGGEKIQPKTPVSISITYDRKIDLSKPGTCQAIHFGNEGPELIEAEALKLKDSRTRFTHIQDSFSVVGDLVTVSLSENEADKGPKRLPVDYYVYIDGKWTCVGSTNTGWYGDYTANGWTDYNRDYITVAQAESMLGKYGFNAGEENPARSVAYQQKSGDVMIYSDTNTVEIDRNKVIPLARNTSHIGYNLYFLPSNNDILSGINSADNLNVSSNAFYTVSVYDPGHIVYKNDDAVPDPQVVKAGTDVEVTVGKMPSDTESSWECVDETWKAVTEGTAKEYNGDTVTFKLTGVTGMRIIMPVADSMKTAASSDNTVHYYVYLDGKWQQAGTTSTIYKDKSIMQRCFVTSAQVESVLAPFGFSSDTYSYTEKKGNSLAYQIGAGSTTDAFYSDNESKKLSDGSWAIGLSSDLNEYGLYYIPNNEILFTDQTPNGYADSGFIKNGNSFWSVTVRDDGHNVYNSRELKKMVYYAVDQKDITVIVRNAEGVIWSCVGRNSINLNVESLQSGGYTTFTIKNVNQPVEIVATKTNPEFTVQYYANIPRFADSGDEKLTVIDTSGKKLPVNGGNMATKSLYLEKSGEDTTENNGDKTPLYRVKIVTELTKMYSDADYHFETSPGLEYFNKLKDNESYNLKEIWVLKPGMDPSSSAENDWTVYDASGGNTGFTNEAAAASDNTILINDGAVLRLVFDTSSGQYKNDNTFYDYNIADGTVEDDVWKTVKSGINSDANYGEHSGKALFAFGNQNCGTGLENEAFSGNTLNKANDFNKEYKKATFGIAESLSADGRIKYNDAIKVPNLFNDGEARGKQTYQGSYLTFERVGDTYTLGSATLKNSDGSEATKENLQYFFNPSPAKGKIWDGQNSGYGWQNKIFTNNFWPMDKANGRTDGLWGKYGNPGKYNTKNEYGHYLSLPVGDDGNAHNWFFGMNFAINFNLTEDYEGPLEYYFFGDDDLWVFLDNQLVCDIGGVHSSIGEYVNLRDYLPVGSSGQHTLTFFYTERGASGSTCYMNFTLPSISTKVISNDTGSLQISKKAKTSDDTGADFSGEEYEFRVELLTDNEGRPLDRTFSYAVSGDDGAAVSYGTVKSGGTIRLKENQTATVKGIPTGTFYEVTETEASRKGYSTTANGTTGYIVSGTIETGQVKPAAFVNTLVRYALPETGGPGTYMYIIGGLLLIAAAGALMIYNQAKHRKEKEK